MSTQQAAITKRTVIFSALGAMLVSGALLGGCAKDPALTVSSVETTIPESGPVEKPAAQIVDTDIATVEYVNTAIANDDAIVTFKFTNKTDKTVVVSASNIVLDEVNNMESSTGSKAPIGPGETGQVDLTLNVAAQKEKTGMSGFAALTADLNVLEEGNESNNLGTVPVSIIV